MKRIRLESGRSHATLAPDVGGSIAGLALGSREVLRPGPASEQADADPRSFSEFPMIPWVNRVAGGRFSWRGREIDVAAGPGHDPQGLHGIGWRMPWKAVEIGPCEASLEFAWAGAANWPFPFRMVRRFSLAPDQLLIEATLTNLGAEAMPLALGFHPYFPSRGAILRATTDAGWRTDAAGIPSVCDLQDPAILLRSGLAIEGAHLDTCFGGWDGEAVIEWPEHVLSVRTMPPMRFLQIYSPPGEGYFCLEPQTAMPDALNRAPEIGGLGLLGGGLSAVFAMSLGIASRDSR